MWLGIDIGTQGVRAIVLDGSGNVVGRGSSPLRSMRRAGRHEQHPEHWWNSTAAACRQAMNSAGGKGPIWGIAVDSTSGTIAVLDGRGRPSGPGLMYDDARALSQSQRLGDQHRSWGQQMAVQASSPQAKMLWLAECGQVPPGYRFAHQADCVTSKLVGGPVPSDSSHALKSGYDVVRCSWPENLEEIIGLRGSSLPKVVEPGTLLGLVDAEASEQSGIPPGTPVFAGMTDGCAGQISAAALGHGDANSILGTTLVIKASSQVLVEDPSGVLYSHRNPDGGWLPGGASNTGGRALAEAFPGADLTSLDAAAAACEPASVVSYPLVGKGERFPFVAPDAEGFSTGPPAGPTDHYAALLQGVAFVERLCYQRLQDLGVDLDGRLSFSGGATKSRYWCQLRADVLGRVAGIPSLPDPAAGMAILAAWASGAYPSLGEAAADLVRFDAWIEPRTGAGELWTEPYETFISALRERGWLPGAQESSG